MKTVSVTFKLSALSYSEIFRFAAASRYPHASQPVATWLGRESLFIVLCGGLLCAVAEFFGALKISPTRLAWQVIPLLLIVWAVYVVLRLWSTYKVYRASHAYVVELSEDGVRVRDRDTEWRTRWKPDHEVAVTAHLVMIRCGKLHTIWIPKHYFASPEDADEFVRAGRLLQAAATSETTYEVKPS